MELSPQSVSGTTFKIVKRGYDPDEVRAYLGQLAGSIETMQNQTAAMEARARAAVSRLQEIAAQAPSQPAAPEPTGPSAQEAETISRTLLLAQRTADQTVADAEQQSKSITETAQADARRTLDGAQEAASRVVEEAKAEARKAGEAQRIEVESEVQALLARREFLLSDVDHLEQHVVTERGRLREVATTLTTIAATAPGGLADVRRPLMSAVESGGHPGHGEGRDATADPDAPRAIELEPPTTESRADDETVPIAIDEPVESASDTTEDTTG